jgi:hypothetical protein
MASDTNFLLVQMTHGKPHPAMNALAPRIEPEIKMVIRSYLSERRAEQDRDLLSEANPSGTYLVLSIHHIDD